MNKSENEPIYYCTNCRRRIEKDEDYCMFCGTKNEHWIPEEDDICKGCYKAIKKDEHQCPSCGLIKGENPDDYYSAMHTVYGPPASHTYKCSNKECRNSFYYGTLGRTPDSLYCPKCGSLAY